MVDDIMFAADKWGLPLNDVDWLSNSIASRGILVYDEDPEKENKIQSQDEDYADYAQSDYEKVYDRVVELEPSLEPFIEDVKKIKPAQFKELSRLIYQAKEGNAYARTRILEAHIRVAIRIGLQRAEQYDADLIDCIGDACIGLIMAFERFNPDTNGPFGSYASYWMYQYMSREQRTQRPEIYYPAHKKEKYFSIYPMLKDKGCTSCDKAWRCEKARRIVQEELYCTREQAEDVILQTLPLDSLDFIVEKGMESEEGDFTENYSLFQKALEELTDQRDFVTDIELNFLRKDIDEMMKTMTERERKVLRDRYGFDDGIEKTLEEVGRELNVTRERVRQIESKAIRKFRKRSWRERLKEYY